MAGATIRCQIRGGGAQHPGRDRRQPDVGSFCRAARSRTPAGVSGPSPQRLATQLVIVLARLCPGVSQIGKGLVGHVGAVLLRKAADQAGLTAGLGAALRKAGQSRADLADLYGTGCGRRQRA
jgi:hypothetical protein